MNEKTQNKFYDWREGVVEGNEDFVLISKGKEGWRYVYKKHHLTDFYICPCSAKELTKQSRISTCRRSFLKSVMPFLPGLLKG